MRKRFNVTGSCNPDRHYMVSTEKRFKAVQALIDAGEYFTINRARQYGKTTMLDMIWRRLKDQYLIIDCSFEGVDDTAYESHAAFAKMFARQVAERLDSQGTDEALVSFWRNCGVANLDDLSIEITRFTKQCPKPVILTIDEVDKSSENQLFLNFLGMLRNMYLQRNKSGVHNGRLNMEHVITRFRDLLREEYRESTGPFLEKEGRLLFLTFLKPIINGIGFYYVEPETRDNRRMDLVVTYDRQEFIVELKIWHGDKYEEKGRDQLSSYLATRGMDEGYLVTFDFSKDRQDTEPQWIDWNGKRLFEVII